MSRTWVDLPAPSSPSITTSILLFYNVNVVPGLGKAELLPGISFQGISGCGEQTDLLVQAVIVLLERLYAAFLAAQRKAGLHPSHHIVFLDEKKQHEYCSYDYGKSDERTLWRLAAVFAPVPYVFKFSHNHKNS